MWILIKALTINLPKDMQDTENDNIIQKIIFGELGAVFFYYFNTFMSKKIR